MKAFTELLILACSLICLRGFTQNASDSTANKSIEKIFVSHILLF
jgi:hypothetical protein